MAKKQGKNKQLEFTGTSGWGGFRSGAGRPNRSGTVNHMKRSLVNLKVPLHVTLRLKERLPGLRNKGLLREFKVGIKKAKKLGLFVIHFSIQSNHIHLFVEAKDNASLALGMRALAGRFAKFVRERAFKQGGEKAGSVFKGRYHLHVLKTPRETRNALEYVLLNLSKHQKLIEYVDPFSSGEIFGKWKRLLGRRYASLVRWDAEYFESNAKESDLSEILPSPRSWLAREGWMKACG